MEIPPDPHPPDPQGENAPQGPRDASTTRSNATAQSGQHSFSVGTSTTPTPSQTPGRAVIKDLAAFEAGRAGRAGRTTNPRKRQAGLGADGRPGTADPVYLGTPRSTRFKNLFEDSTPTPSLLTVVKKLYELIDESIRLPRKGAEKITSLGSETAADIKTLAASALDLAEGLVDIPQPRRNLFGNDDEDRCVERALAGTNAFGCQVPDVLEKKLDKITQSLATLQHAMQIDHQRPKDFNFNKPPQTNTTPSYALAASKHAPQTAARAAPTTFRPVIHKKQATTAPAPALTRSQNSITIVQAQPGGLELANLSYPALITKFNAQLALSNIKENATDSKSIQIRSIHRHPSNDLVLYTTSPKQADALRATHQRWLPQTTQHMTLRNPIYPVVVHGIPASFDPNCPDHMEMLIAMNQDTLSPPPQFVKWVSPQAIKRGVSHSSIRLGFSSLEQAKKAVEERIFYGRFNKRTENGRVARARCMNCLQEGHTSNYCKEQVMCPYCSEGHQADKCPSKGLITTSCTACARHMKTANPSLDLKALFAKTPVGLRHSPLDPTCPTRIAGLVEKERRATAQREQQATEAAAQQAATKVTSTTSGTGTIGGENTTPSTIVGNEEANNMDDVQC